MHRKPPTLLAPRPGSAVRLPAELPSAGSPPTRTAWKTPPPKTPLLRATEPGTLPNTSTGTSLTSLAATVRALAGIYSPQPPGCRKEDSSSQICTLQ
jgi:hypothetical protein